MPEYMCVYMYVFIYRETYARVSLFSKLIQQLIYM